MLSVLKKKRVYLDWASGAPLSEHAERVFLQALRAYGNPSSPHTEGEQARSVLESARTTIARLAGVKTDSIIFTSGATEANALAIQGHARALIKAGSKPEDLHMLYVPTAHASVIETMDMMRALGVQAEPLLIAEGGIDLAALKQQLRPETVLVSLDAVCGETGTCYATRDVRRILDAANQEQKSSRGLQVLLHIDASQAPFVDSINRNHLGADMLTLDAQKIGGVRGVGALIRTNTFLPLAPLMYGGGQEQGLRPGTENPALAIAFATALVDAQKDTKQKITFKARATLAREEVISMLKGTFPDVSVNVGKAGVPHILNLSFPDRDTDYAIMLLSQTGYAVSTKSACETDTAGSRAVLALLRDQPDKEKRALSTLRVSWGPTTRARDLKEFTKALIRTIQFLDTHSNFS